MATTKIRVGKTLDNMLNRIVRARAADLGIVLEKAEVNAFARYVARAQHDFVYEASVQKQYGGALDSFSIMMEKGAVGVPQEQEYDALAWLYKNRRQLKLGQREMEVLQCFSHFSLFSFRAEKRGASWYAAPEWCVWNRSLASSFSYVAWSWQSGAKPVLCN